MLLSDGCRESLLGAMHQDRIVFHAGVPEVSVTASGLSGRCWAVIARACHCGNSLSRNMLLSWERAMVSPVPVPLPGLG